VGLYMIKHSIIIPAYNEQEGLPLVLDKLLPIINNSYEVIVVDDGSEDQTSEIAKRFNVKTICLSVNMGKGMAMRNGIESAHGENMIFIDADNTYPADSVPDIAQLLEEYDMVIGVRKTRINIKVFNRFGNDLFKNLLKFFFKTQVSDPLCGLYGIRKKFLNKMQLESLGFEIESEIAIKAAGMGLRVKEISIHYDARIGESKLNPIRDGFRILKNIINFLFVFNPTYGFIYPGLILFAVSFLLLLLTSFTNFSIGNINLDVHSFIFSGMASIVGFQFITFGLIAKIYASLFKNIPADGLVTYIMNKGILRPALVIGAISTSFGLILIIHIVFEWVESGLAPIMKIKESIIAFFLFIMGIQIIFSTFFLSIFLPKISSTKKDSQILHPDSIKPKHDTTPKSMNLQRVCVIGPGTRFLSGITYYTFHLANAFSEKYKVSIVTLRNLVPAFLFPGRKRVGRSLMNLKLNDQIDVFDGIDWFFFPKIFTVPFFLMRNKPEVIIFQWWTSSVAHNYLALLIFIKILLRKSRLILTFHETLDPLEDSFVFLRIYSKIMGKMIFGFFDDYAAHSQSDLELINDKLLIPKEKISLVEMGSFDHLKKTKRGDRENDLTCTLVFFGLIRPYKGVEYLIEAFDLIPKNRIFDFKLIVAGEAWGYNVPEKKIKSSPYKERIRYINRYLSDDELSELLNEADVAIFPYTRASQSGAAHTAISYGIPIIVSHVGGLKESMAPYKGTIFVEPCNIEELRDAILKSYELKGKFFQNPHPWKNSVASYENIFLNNPQKK
jgi:glycosyltransferase involved in cell wall biosynthesis